MKAALSEKYGSAEIVDIKDVPRPEIDDDQILVQVFATSVTSADWRLRASAFPGGLWLMGRLMMGLFAPKNKILGSDFAGRVVAIGSNVTDFKMGDAVFGFSSAFGAHAEYLAIQHTGTIAKIPSNFDYDEAASLPFGAICALVFLRDFGTVKPGQKVLIGGASGGVGAYAIQIAKHLGADVTAITSTRNINLVRNLGADQVIDYTQEDLTKTGAQYDLVFDTAGTMTYAQARKVLKTSGAFMPLEMDIGTLLQALFAKVTGGQKIIMNINGDSQTDLQSIADLATNSKINPVIDSHFSLSEIRDAYRRVEGRHKTGSVIVTIANTETHRLAAE